MKDVLLNKGSSNGGGQQLKGGGKIDPRAIGDNFFTYTGRLSSEQNDFRIFGSQDYLAEKKHYNVTTDDVRRRLIALWATGTKNIKEVRIIIK